jgi:hypothetical protein
VEGGGTGQWKAEDRDRQAEVQDRGYSSGKRKVVEGRESEKQKVMKGTGNGGRDIGRLETLERKNKNAVHGQREKRRGVHCKKRLKIFPSAVPSRDVTNQTLPGSE